MSNEQIQQLITEYYECELDITHWMPLPQPPRKED